MRTYHSTGLRPSVLFDIVPDEDIPLYRNDTGGEVLVRDNAQMFDLFVDRSNYDTSVTVVRNITRDWHEPMVLHSVNIENTGSLHIKLEQILNIVFYLISYLMKTYHSIGLSSSVLFDILPDEDIPLYWFKF
jgi:hypothetical protein